MQKLKKLISFLQTNNLSISAAESCSGGYLSYLLTKLPGSSKVFKGAVIAYSPEVKNKFFAIPYLRLKKTNAVSEDIALTLAKKIRKLLKTDIGVSIVGFAGPTAKKGVKAGTVILSVADKKGAIAKKIFISGNRDTVRKKASRLLIKLAYAKISNP
jgi:PncC family amidohydrolase